MSQAIKENEPLNSILRALNEVEGKALLNRYGVKTPNGVVLKGHELDTSSFQEIPSPWAVKILSPDVQHKSDGGYVALGLRSSDEVFAAISRMRESAIEHGHRIEGFLVEEMSEPGVEVIVGGFTDPTFGPCVMFGLGGVYVEVLKDVAFRVCPVSRVDAEDMIAELTGKPILDGARGGAAVSFETLIDLIIAIGGEQGVMLKNDPPIHEIDLNPVIVRGASAMAVDALVLSRGGVSW